MIKTTKVWDGKKNLIHENGKEQVTTITVLDREPSYKFKHDFRYLNVEVVIGHRIMPVRMDLGEPTGEMRSIVCDGTIARVYKEFEFKNEAVVETPERDADFDRHGMPISKGNFTSDSTVFTGVNVNKDDKLS